MLRPNLRRTLKPTLNRFMGGGGSPPAVNYVARLNGTDQHWQLSEGKDVSPSEYITFKIIVDASAQNGQYKRFIASEDFNFSLDTGASGGKFRLAGCNATIDGNPMVSEVTEIPADDQPHEIVVRPSAGGRVEVIGALLAVPGRSIDASILDFCIYGESEALIHKIPLTNKAQGATQLATVGNVNAFMPNYTPDVWEVNNANN